MILRVGIDVWPAQNNKPFKKTKKPFKNTKAQFPL